MKYWIPVILIILTFSGCRSLPSGKQDGGDELARKVMQATGAQHWDTTKVVAFTFGKRQHLWDKERELVWIRWKDIEVMESLKTKEGKVWKDGELLPEKKARKYLEKAWNRWANDSFWFYPFFKLFDEGTRRKVVEQEDGSKALLVTYMEGGLTPGDSYLWLLDEEGMPVAWRLWVKIIPVKGYKFTWEEWEELSTGIKVAKQHESTFFDIELSDVKAAKSIDALYPEGDPFDRLKD